MAEPYNEFWFRWWRKITEHGPADIPHPHTGSSEFCDVCNRSILGHEEGTAAEIAQYEAQLRRRARTDWYAMPPKQFGFDQPGHMAEPDESGSRVFPWVREFVEETLGPAPFGHGDRVRHPDGRMVQITKGQYWGMHGISNFWYWREVLEDGTLSDTEEHGYGWHPKTVPEHS